MFNWLYLTVTLAVQDRVKAGEFRDPARLTRLDVQFAALYLYAARRALRGAPCPGCWEALFAVRSDAHLTRVQFALAGMNAHINRDLCLAIVSTCKAADVVPEPGTAQHHDFTSINRTLDSLIGEAKRTLNVRLSGDPLPAASALEDVVASWDLVGAARESAWKNAERLRRLPPAMADGLLEMIDELTAVASKALLLPVPLASG